MWPFIPLFALVSLLRTMMVKVKKVMADAKKIPISTLAARLVGILIVGVSVWGAIKYIPSHTSGRISAIVRLPAVVIFVVILAFEPVRFLPRYILRRRRDIRLVDRFFSNDGQFTVTRICGALYEIKTERGIRLFVESALRIDPIAYPEMIRTLSDIAATAEVKRKGPGAIVASGVTPEFADWFKGHAGGESRAPTVLFVIRSLPATTLDQIARAAEQTEVARGSAPSQANE
jgi:hypothetical protein